MEADRTTDVESVSVKAQFRHRIKASICIYARIEIVSRIESIVAQKFPPRSMELTGSGLNDGAHCRRRRKAVFRAVICGEHAEFGKSIDRGHHARTTGA